MRLCVVDASAAAAWLLPDEAETGAKALTDVAAATLHAPWLFWAELRNILIVCERRGRVPEGAAEAFLSALDGLAIAFDTVPSDAEVLRLSRGYGLTVYDALYLELALRLQAPLLTLDRKLARAAQDAGVDARI